METRMEKMADITILELRGEKLVESNAKDFKQGLASVLASKHKMVFDMSRLQFVDNSGLGVLLSCLRKLHAAGGELKLFGLTDQVRKLIELVRMHRIFDIYNTREEACRAYLN
jgi:anti-sigma B factor antagonist